MANFPSDPLNQTIISRLKKIQTSDETDRSYIYEIGASGSGVITTSLLTLLTVTLSAGQIALVTGVSVGTSVSTVNAIEVHDTNGKRHSVPNGVPSVPIPCLDSIIVKASLAASSGTGYAVITYRIVKV